MISWGVNTIGLFMGLFAAAMSLLAGFEVWISGGGYFSGLLF